MKIERSQENDKNLGVLWKDIRVIDKEGNYIIFRQQTGLNKKKYIAQSGKIENTLFYRNDDLFKKEGRGRIKKIVEDKLNNILNWAYKNIEEKPIVEDLKLRR